MFWSNNIFLNDLCHRIVFSISEFPTNTPSLSTDWHRPLISTHPPHIWSLSRFYFFNIVPILCTLIIPTHGPYYFPYMVLNTNITLNKNLSILSNTITKLISPNCHARKTSTTPVRFLHIFQLRFTQITQLSSLYFSKKELQWVFCSNKFFLLITSPRVLSWQVQLG